MPGRRLKVFQSQLGFYDTVVAVSSQAAALRAWGVSQNLFADGQARLAQDQAAIKAALAHPQVPLQRAVGTNDAFAPHPRSRPKAPETGGKAPRAPSEGRRKPVAKPPPDRSKLVAAEMALTELEEAHRRREAEIDDRRRELDAARKAARAEFASDRKAAMEAVADARRTYRKAGGKA